MTTTLHVPGAWSSAFFLPILEVRSLTNRLDHVLRSWCSLGVSGRSTQSAGTRRLPLPSPITLKWRPGQNPSTEDKIIDASTAPEPGNQADGITAEVTFPEAVMLLLFNPRNGIFAGEGLNLMYVLGGAMVTELAAGGHIELTDNGRRVRRVEPAPASSLLRGAWDRVPENPTGVRSLVVDIGTRSRETTLNRLVVRGDISKKPQRLLGFIRTHSLEGGHTDTRDRLLAPVRAALVDGTEPEAKSAAVIALLSASKNLPSMNADIPWSGDVYTRGKKFERGDWGAKAASDVILTSIVTQLAGVAFATALDRLTDPD